MARRNESTAFLKECIADALLRLMEDKPQDRITAQEIATLAGVGRATVFRHFKTKGEILTFKLVQLWAHWAQEHNLIDVRTFSLLTTEALFAFNLSIRPMLCKIYEAGMQSCIYDAFYQIMAPQFGGELAHCYANSFYSYAIFGLLDEWVKRGFRETPQQMADIVVHEIVGRNIFIS